MDKKWSESFANNVGSNLTSYVDNKQKLLFQWFHDFFGASYTKLQFSI